MSNLIINGTIISQNKIDTLSHHRTADNIMSLKDKIKDFFSKNKEREALNLIHDVYYNHSNSMTEKIECFKQLDSLVGENYKKFFNIKMEGNKVIFSINNEDKITFSLKELIYDVIVNTKSREKENINLETNLNLLGDTLFIEKEANKINRQIEQKNILTDDDSISTIIKKIKIEFFLSLTEAISRNESINIIDPSWFEFIFNKKTDILMALKNILSPTHSIKEVIKDFNLLKALVKDDYKEYLSLYIENDKIRINFGKFNQQFDFYNLIKETLLVLKEKNTKFDDIDNLVKNIKDEVINNVKGQPEYNSSILELTKREIKRQLFVGEVRKNDDDYHFIEKMLNQTEYFLPPDTEDKQNLRYFYSIINNKEHPYHARLTEIGEVYKALAINSQPRNGNERVKKYMALFLNKETTSLKDKLDSFVFLKRSLNNESLLDFNLTQDSIEFHQRNESGEIIQSAHNPLDKNIINQIFAFDKNTQFFILHLHFVKEMPLEKAINTVKTVNE